MRKGAPREAPATTTATVAGKDGPLALALATCVGPGSRWEGHSVGEIAATEFGVEWLIWAAKRLAGPTGEAAAIVLEHGTFRTSLERAA